MKNPLNYIKLTEKCGTLVQNNELYCQKYMAWLQSTAKCIFRTLVWSLRSDKLL